MRLSISNLAWDPTEDEEIAGILNKRGINAIDIAPGKYFSNPTSTTLNEIKAVRQWWRERDIDIVGMQALLFGTVGLNLFGDSDSQRKMLDHLGAVCRIGGEMGALRLAFGSPKNRDRSGFSDDEAISTAVAFLTRLGDVAQQEGVSICLEPNPVCYGANFMTTSFDTAAVVAATNHFAIRMQLDTGAMAINGEDPQEVLDHYGTLVGHIHISEPNLVPLGDGQMDHASYGAAIARSLCGYVATIEMLATKNEPHFVSIERAIETARQYY